MERFLWKHNCFRPRVSILGFAIPENGFDISGASLFQPQNRRFTRDWHISYKFHLLVTRRKVILTNRLEYSWQQDWYLSTVTSPRKKTDKVAFRTWNQRGKMRLYFILESLIYNSQFSHFAQRYPCLWRKLLFLHLDKKHIPKKFQSGIMQNMLKWI